MEFSVPFLRVVVFRSVSVFLCLLFWFALWPCLRRFFSLFWVYASLVCSVHFVVVFWVLRVFWCDSLILRGRGTSTVRFFLRISCVLSVLVLCCPASRCLLACLWVRVPPRLLVFCPLCPLFVSFVLLWYAFSFVFCAFLVTLARCLGLFLRWLFLALQLLPGSLVRFSRPLRFAGSLILSSALVFIRPPLARWCGALPALSLLLFWFFAIGCVRLPCLFPSCPGLRLFFPVFPVFFSPPTQEGGTELSEERNWNRFSGNSVGNFVIECTWKNLQTAVRIYGSYLRTKIDAMIGSLIRTNLA